MPLPQCLFGELRPRLTTRSRWTAISEVGEEMAEATYNRCDPMQAKKGGSRSKGNLEIVEEQLEP